MKHTCEIKGYPNPNNWWWTQTTLTPVWSQIKRNPNLWIFRCHHFTGCTRHPQPDSHYCWEHKSGDSPVIAAENVSSRTRQKLKGTKDTKNYSEEQYFIVESIKEITTDNLYKVKWVGFEDETLKPWDQVNSIGTVEDPLSPKEEGVFQQIKSQRKIIQDIVVKTKVQEMNYPFQHLQ